MISTKRVKDKVGPYKTSSSGSSSPSSSPVSVRKSGSRSMKTVCNICGKKYTSVGNLNAHKNTAHFGQKWRCKICGRICQTKRAVKISCKNHHPGRSAVTLMFGS
jgi:hypothetical protein